MTRLVCSVLAGTFTLLVFSQIRGPTWAVITTWAVGYLGIISTGVLISIFREEPT